VPALPSLKKNKLAGAFLISPWVTFTDVSMSMKENASKDWVIQSLLRESSSLFMNGKEEDEYNVPLMAADWWWRGLRVGQVGALAGDYEIFRDDVEGWVRKVKVSSRTGFSGEETWLI
jgi:acetyl esterase/lipase